MEWTAVPPFTDEVTPLDQRAVVAWCKKHIVGHGFTVVPSFMEAICLALCCDEVQLWQKVCEQYLATKSFTNSTVMYWLNASPQFSTLELLEHYLRLGKLVDGLFLWLASVVTKAYMNFVHSDQAWTIRASDVVNLMDATIVAAEGSFLVASSLTEVMVKEVWKSEDIYNNPLDTVGRFVTHARALNYPVTDLLSHCGDMGLCPFGQDHLLADLLAELFNLLVLQYSSCLMEWVQHYLCHLECAFVWWEA